MTSGSITKRILAVLIAAGVLASVWTLWTRARIPQAGPESEFVVELETVYESSRLHGIPVAVLLDAYREAGVTTIGVESKSVARLEYDGLANLVYNPATGLYDIRLTAAAPVDLGPWLARELERWAPRHLVATGEAVPGSLEAALPAYYPPPRKDKEPLPTDVFRKPTDPLAVAPPERDLVLGICPADVALARTHGFLVAAFVANRPGMTAEQALWSLEGFGAGAGVSAVKFDGDTALGWPDPEALKAVGRRLAGMGVPFVVDDKPEAGLLTVAQEAGWRGVRQQPVWTRVEPARFPEVASERRQNFLYLQTAFFDGTSPDWLDQVTAGLKAIVGAMESSGLKMAKTVPFSPYAPPRLALALIVSGVLAAVFLGLALLLEGTIPRRLDWAAGLLFALAWAVPVLIILTQGTEPSGLPLKVELAAGFLASVVFPLLGLGLAVRYGPAAAGAAAGRPPNRGWRALRAAVVAAGAAALAVAGGLLTLTSGANTAFMLGLQTFRGTKLSLLLPPLLAVVVFFGTVGLYPERAAGGSRRAGTDSVPGRAVAQMVRFLRENVTFAYVFLFGLAAVAGLILIMRSGNFPTLQIPGLELKLRAFLQQTLLVRPRTKEFLIGYPALVLFGYWGARLRETAWGRWAALVLVVAAAVGLGSVGNTYAHHHIPVSISLLRSLNGLILGLVLSFAAVVVTELLLRLGTGRRAGTAGPEARGGGKASS